MSLFIDVIEDLSDKIKAALNKVIEQEKKDQDRSLRKICDTCSKYLDYGELRYDKMEDGISRLKEAGLSVSAFSVMLMAVMNESLDEDLVALEHFAEFKESSLAAPFYAELCDFIAIARFATLKEYDKLEEAGSIMVDRYTNEANITDTLSNLYLKAEQEEYIPVFQRLVARAKERYPSCMPLEGLNGFISMKGKDYQQALASFLNIKNSLEKEKDNPFYNHNLASTWDNIADCYLKMGDAAKTIESCDIALGYDNNGENYKVGNPILYKKAEALLLLGDKEQALVMVNQILDENKDDEKALEIRASISAG